ncbi:MAG: hypothetical protein GTN81_10760 [Proteobacteria bacterium]|nr:hypothetical protein [Pseudomonadota bacterium]
MDMFFTEQTGNIYCLPICHYRIEFAQIVRQAIDKIQPHAIAAELPATLEKKIRLGIDRLPVVSLLLYENDKGESIYLLIEPADPLVEAIRYGQEKGIPTFLVDVDGDEYPRFRDPVPDPYAILRVGHRAYYQSFRKHALRGLKKSPQDRIREQGMAFHLQRIKDNFSSLLFVCGMVHLEGVRRELTRPQTHPMGRIRRKTVQLFNLHPDSMGEVMSAFPFLSATYEYHRAELPPDPPGRRYTVRKTLKSSAFGVVDGGKIVSEEKALEEALVWSTHRVIDPTSSMIDRQRVNLRLFERAAVHYLQDTGERIAEWQKRTFFKFSRNYAMLDGLLLSDFYHCLTSARAAVDDNFCYAMWRLGCYYPWLEDPASLPTLKISGDQIFMGTRRIHIRRRMHKPRQRPVWLPVRRRPRERFPGEWLGQFDSKGICSYPPEDLVIENYGQFLKKKGGRLLSEEQGRIVPMTVSLLDGIDIRETLRHSHEKRIFVRENIVMKGAVGSVVVIFDTDDQNRFPYCMTWHGEHDQESDMAFYATDPGDNVPGPGIGRCEYGGFLLSYPPLRMLDVWMDPEYRWFQSKSEKLLIAALDYSIEKHVVYVAARPPRSYMKVLASRMERKIVYVPIGTLSPETLKKIRVFHVLFGRDKREIAKDYIW